MDFIKGKRKRREGRGGKRKYNDGGERGRDKRFMSYWEGRKYFYCQISSSIRTNLLRDCFSELFCDYFTLNKLSERFIEGVHIQHNKLLLHHLDTEEIKTPKKKKTIFQCFGEMISQMIQIRTSPIFIFHMDFICYSEIFALGCNEFPYTGLSILHVSPLLKSILAFMIRYDMLEIVKHDPIHSTFHYRIVDSFLPSWYIYYEQFLIFLLCFTFRSMYKIESTIRYETKTSMGMFNLIFPHCPRDKKVVQAWDIIKKSIETKVMNEPYPFYKLVRAKTRHSLPFNESLTRDPISRINSWKNRTL